MKKGITLFFFCLHCLLWIFPHRAAAGPVVFVSIVPQKFFVEQIGGGYFDVRVMVEPGANPATYEPKPSQMAKLTSAKLYFAVGVPFESAWLDRIAAVNRGMQIVYTDRKIAKIMMVEKHQLPLPLAQHVVGGRYSIPLDPHIWLSPGLVKKQAAVILSALAAIAPQRSAEFRENHRLFVEKITALDQQLRLLFRDKQGLQFMVFHPSWGYFAREYDLRQIAVEMAGKSPKFAQLQKLIHYARDKNIRIIFVQPQFSTKKAEIIAREIHGRVVTADPLAYEWFANLRSVAEKISGAIR